MKCNTAEDMIMLMHDYLDNDITAEEEKVLRHHLQACEACQTHFHELNKAVALMKSLTNVQPSIDFTANVMKKLPKEKKRVRVTRWLQVHPLLSAAAVFFILMMGSMFSYWTEDQQFSVSKQPNLVIENDTVIVPEGKVVTGDIVVKNGNIRIEGEVQGDVTIINGEQYMASAGRVTGNIEEVNKMFEWLWYHMKKTTVDVVKVFE
ncbi:anti-sigma factor [Bacillus sp. HMF5848]|uniref:anti-sigma factor family protein n=1 Tax=Bacillus sp. HMF5848 TaxID=2495421 RepID=UPI000F7B91D9|nr:anti-sigma factor [Bacillus sp. HMF5848]RSK25593.1 anti-sigma factor [Bacillus sp. HMF5848]